MNCGCVQSSYSKGEASWLGVALSCLSRLGEHAVGRWSGRRSTPNMELQGRPPAVADSAGQCGFALKSPAGGPQAGTQGMPGAEGPSRPVGRQGPCSKDSGPGPSPGVHTGQVLAGGGQGLSDVHLPLALSDSSSGSHSMHAQWPPLSGSPLAPRFISCAHGARAWARARSLRVPRRERGYRERMRIEDRGSESESESESESARSREDRERMTIEDRGSIRVRVRVRVRVGEIGTEVHVTCVPTPV